MKKNELKNYEHPCLPTENMLSCKKYVKTENTLMLNSYVKPMQSESENVNMISKTQQVFFKFINKYGL